MPVPFQRLLESIRSEGAFVNASVQRCEATPSGAPGLIVSEAVLKGERVFSVPRHVQLSRGTANRYMPGLASTVEAAHPGVSIESPGLVAFVAVILSQLPACRTEGCPPVVASSGSLPDWINDFARVASCATFSGMPIKLCDSDTEIIEVFNPSPEGTLARQQYETVRKIFEAVVDAGLPDFDQVEFDHFMCAHLILETRVFMSRRQESFLLPVADMLNHSPKPNATWTFDSEGSFEVTTTADVRAGGELLISYGKDKSNPRLFRMYGFTLPCDQEPCFSFRSLPCRAVEVYAKFLPGARVKSIDLDSGRINNSLKLQIRACVAMGVEPVVFLRHFCMHFAAGYEADPQIAPWVRCFEQVRSLDFRWWSCAARPTDDEPEEDFIYLCAKRVKMSEYICLKMHLLALDLEESLIEPADCAVEVVALHAKISKVFARYASTLIHPQIGRSARSSLRTIAQ